MRTNRVEITSLYAACSSKDCDFRVDVRNTDYRKWVTTPCPCCGSTVLSLQDYKFLQDYEREVAEMNATPMTEAEMNEPIYTSSVETSNGQLISLTEPVPVDN